MAVTVTPCPSTVTSTATVTETATVSNFPMKRAAIAAGIEVRQEASSCVFTTETPTALPAYATTACPALGTTALPADRLSSACSCNGVTASTTTLATPITTVTATSTVSATVSATPSALILNASGDQSLYVTVDDAGALRLTHDETVATPFYVDNSGQLRNLHDPTKLLVDYYEPSPGTSDNKVYNAVPQPGANYPITCSNYSHSDGAYWGNCQASGPPNGNPVVYGFGTCPNEGYYVYMNPKYSNVHCFDGGYSFLGFFLRAYTGA
jgi:hypothetical protein